MLNLLPTHKPCDICLHAMFIYSLQKYNKLQKGKEYFMLRKPFVQSKKCIWVSLSGTLNNEHKKQKDKEKQPI